jgi:DNA-binding response OmpR family regulator
MLRPRPPVGVIPDIEPSSNSGCDFCKQIAKSIPNTPRIILSARSDAADKVIFLGIGADDYGTIPFRKRELIPRALIRRASHFRQNRSADRCASLEATTNYKVTDDEQLVSEALRNRYFSLTTAEPSQRYFLYDGRRAETGRSEAMSHPRPSAVCQIK